VFFNPSFSGCEVSGMGFHTAVVSHAHGDEVVGLSLSSDIATCRMTGTWYLSFRKLTLELARGQTRGSRLSSGVAGVDG
jgi:hypothetical protein